MTQELPQVPVPEHAPFSQWTHYNPVLVEALAAHGGVPEQEVVDHLNELFRESDNDPRVRPLERQAAALSRYLDEYVVVG
jgi:hypothetical protein